MPDAHDHPPRPATAPVDASAAAARWMVTFLGFPLGGLAADLLAGPVDSLVAALVGGLVTGAVLGAVRRGDSAAAGPPAGSGGSSPPRVGLMVGLGVGAGRGRLRHRPHRAASSRAPSAALAVGAAQAVVLRPRLGRLALAWPPALAAIWALGWAVTTAVGVQVDEQFTVFGSSGALVVTALTAVLPSSSSTASNGAPRHDPARRLRHRPGRPPRRRAARRPRRTTSSP